MTEKVEFTKYGFFYENERDNSVTLVKSGEITTCWDGAFGYVGEIIKDQFGNEVGIVISNRDKDGYYTVKVQAKEDYLWTQN